MAVYKCKMCGAALEVAGGASVVTCEYCDTPQTIPTVKDENLQGLFNRANTLRLKCDFDKAETLYEKIIQTDPTQAEAYWGLILCRYGIEYVEDKKTYKRIPTCHRASFESIIADEDYKSALNNADSIQRIIFESEAREIDRIQKEILEISRNEEPYDVFICYKETDDSGKRTQDSVIANDIYYQLTQEGFKVFYAAITLEDKLGSAYEPCIFAALNSAKVMLAIGTKPEYFNAVWVKNEWSRFLKIVKSDRSKMLVPCYRDMDAYDLPDEFAHLQAQDMSKLGFIPDLVRNIKKIVGKDEPVVTQNVSTTVQTVSTNSAVHPLLMRASMYIEDGNFASADDYCEKVLDQEPQNAKAYLYKLLCELKLNSVEKLADVGGVAQLKAREGSVRIKAFSQDKKIEAIKIMRAVGGWGLIEAKNFVERPNTLQVFAVTKEQAQELSACGATLEYIDAGKGDNVTLSNVEKNGNYQKFVRFASESEIEEVELYLNRAKNKVILAAKKEAYQVALSAMRRAVSQMDFVSAASKFEALEDFEDSSSKANECRNKAELARKESIYISAKDSIRTKNLDGMNVAFEDLEQILDYKDSADIRASLPSLISQLKADNEKQRVSDQYVAIRRKADNAVQTKQPIILNRAIAELKLLVDYNDNNNIAPLADTAGSIRYYVTKLDELRKAEAEELFKKKTRADYEKEYPILKNADTIKSEYQTKKTEYDKKVTARKDDKTGSGCIWVIAIIITSIVLMLLKFFIEEELTFLVIIAIIALLVIAFFMWAIVSTSKDSKNALKTAKSNFSAAESKLRELNSVPEFGNYLAERRSRVKTEDLLKALPNLENPYVDLGSNNASNSAPVITRTVFCKTCGAANQVKDNALNPVCEYCHSKLSLNIPNVNAAKDNFIPTPKEVKAEVKPASSSTAKVDVLLVSPGANKISVIKVLREITGLGLKEAKDIVDKTPQVIKSSVAENEADKIIAKFAEVGAIAAKK